jgi:hypothetical protein
MVLLTDCVAGPGTQKYARESWAGTRYEHTLGNLCDWLLLLGNLCDWLLLLGNLCDWLLLLGNLCGWLLLLGNLCGWLLLLGNLCGWLLLLGNLCDWLLLLGNLCDWLLGQSMAAALLGAHSDYPTVEAFMDSFRVLTTSSSSVLTTGF